MSITKNHESEHCVTVLAGQSKCYGVFNVEDTWNFSARARIISLIHLSTALPKHFFQTVSSEALSCFETFFLSFHQSTACTIKEREYIQYSHVLWWCRRLVKAWNKVLNSRLRPNLNDSALYIILQWLFYSYQHFLYHFFFHFHTQMQNHSFLRN